jgi:hypothetical protein
MKSVTVSLALLGTGVALCCVDCFFQTKFHVRFPLPIYLSLGERDCDGFLTYHDLIVPSFTSLSVVVGGASASVVMYLRIKRQQKKGLIG